MLHNIGMSRFLLTLAAIASFFLFTSEALAQASLGSPNPVQYIVSPEVPGPGDTVLIEVQGIGSFLGSAKITWQVDGKTVKSGVGERSLSFTVGPLGSQTSVALTINSSTNGTITKNFSFRPSMVNMLWEADTSAPVWYKGKSLYTAGSSLTVVAFPQVVSGGKTVSTKNLVFNWSHNGTPLPQQSGAGLNHITFKGSQLLSGETAGVDVLSGGNTVAHGEIYIPASKPKVALYVRDPLRGVLYDSALGSSISLSQTELTVQAVRYFFANLSIQNGSAPYAWDLNNETVTGPQTAGGILTLRQSGSGAGQARLVVSAQNTESDKYVQSASASLTILFGGAQSGAFSSFFGL